MPFVDTNVLLYAVSHAPAESAKAARANELLDRRDLVLSTQVLQEFYVQATRATRPDRLDERDAAALVETFLRFDVRAVTIEVVLAAIAAAREFGISYWDAAIVEAARTSGCDTVLSEDLTDGRDYAGVRVENPFAGL